MRIREAATAFALLTLASCDRSSTSAAPAASTRTPRPAASLEAAPSPRVPPAPPYDLAADLAARADRARARFGASTPTRVEGGAFLFVDPDRGPSFESSVRLAHDALAALFHGRFGEPPDRAVTVYVFSSTKAFDAYAAERFHTAPGDFLGFYRRSTREIFVDASLGRTTLTHEIVHPIVERDFPRAPAWIDEGLGALFEMPVLPRPGEIHGVKNWRYPRLRQAIDAKDPAARLDALFRLSNADFFARDADLHYSVARFACEWLDSTGELWPFYRLWRDGFADDPTGEKAFLAVTGQTPAEANDAWTKWVRAL